MTVVSYNIPEELDQRIRDLAEEEGRSLSAMATRLLEKALGAKKVQRVVLPDWAPRVMDAFWEFYPRKTNKKKSLEMLAKMIAKKPDLAFWRSVLNDVKSRFTQTDKRFVPHATTYLNQERWEDEVIHENAPRNPASSTDRIREQTRRAMLDAETEEAYSRTLGEDDAASRPALGGPGGRLIDSEGGVY